MNEAVRKFFEAKNIAVVGVSHSSLKFGSSVFRALKSKGYNVFPVHPTLDEFRNVKCYKNLNELPDKVESVFISVKPEKAGDIVDEAVNIGALNIWFQQGADFSKLAQKAVDANINVIEKKCILMYAEPVKGIHAFHRFIVKLFNKY